MTARAVAVCCALASLLRGQANANLEKLVADLGNETQFQVRQDAYQALLREKPPAAIPLLLEALPKYQTYSQTLGVSLLQSYPPEVGQAALRKLLKPTAPLLELCAAVALLRTGDQSVVDHIVQPLGRPDATPAVRSTMLNQVWGIKEPRVLAAVRALVAPESPTVVLDNALYHLLQTDDRETKARAQALAAAPALAEDARILVSACLVALGEDEQNAPLAEAMRKAGGASIYRVQKYLLKAPRLGEGVVAAIAAIAEKPEAPGYAQTALNLLGQFGTSKELPLLKKLIESKEPLVAKAALEAYQKQAGSLSPAAWTSLLASDKPELAVSAADMLRRMDDHSGLARVLELCKQPGPHRAEAVRVLGRFKVSAAIDPLVEALLDQDQSVRTAAQQGLGMLLPSLYPYRRFDLATAGYQASGPAAQRGEAVRKIRAWFAAHDKR